MPDARQQPPKRKPTTAKRATTTRAKRPSAASAKRTAPAPKPVEPSLDGKPQGRSQPGGRELLEDWRRVMDGVISSAASRAGSTSLPRDVLRATQRQLELVQELVDRERGVQGEIASRVVAPIDAIFDLLEETGVTLRRQAEALESAGRALEETASLMKTQSERFERTVSALRRPTELAKAAAGVRPRAPRAGRSARPAPGDD